MKYIDTRPPALERNEPYATIAFLLDGLKAAAAIAIIFVIAGYAAGWL